MAQQDFRRNVRATYIAICLAISTAPVHSSWAAQPEDCEELLDAADVFAHAQPATRGDVRFFEAYIGEYHSERLTFDESDIEYYFALHYEWFDEAKSTIKFSVTMVIPEQDRKILRSEGYYAFDPFNERLYAVGAFKQSGAALAVMDYFDQDTGERTLLGRMQPADGKVTLISDQFAWIDDDTLRNRAYACTTDSRQWAQVYEGVYTRQKAAAGGDSTERG